MDTVNIDTYWSKLREQAVAITEREPGLAVLCNETVLERSSFADCIAYRSTRKLANHAASVELLHTAFLEAFDEEPDILRQIACDMQAVCDRDPACPDVLTPLHYFKGFQALVCYRVAHFLWRHDRREFALYLQSLVAQTFAVDIHPAAKIACGILLDHATGFVAGETTVIENDVSILHEVTLGGTGKDRVTVTLKYALESYLELVQRFLEMSKLVSVQRSVLVA